MKKINFALVGIITVGLFASCASNKISKQEPVVAKSVTREIIDWKGASIGSDIPAWIEECVNNDVSSLSKLPQLQKKVIICEDEKGKNLDLLKSWVNNFEVQSTFSKSISNYISQKFGGELAGSKDSAISQTYLDELVSTISRTEITGLSKELDYWIQTRVTDKVKDTVTDEYQYFVVYAIDCSTLEYQIAEALGMVEAQNEAENELKERIVKEMESTQVLYESSRK